MQKLSTIVLCLGIVFVALSPLVANASFYDGGGLQEGIGDAQGFDTGGTGDPRATLERILFGIISFMGIIAVLVIVIAGIILIVGGSDEQQRQKAWKMVIYAIIGLIIILLAGALVSFTLQVFD